MTLNVIPGSCASSRLSSERHENEASSVELLSNPLSAGAQGKIYRVTRIDGANRKGLLVKIFEIGVPKNLRETVTLISQSGIQDISACIALRALPLFLFDASLLGRTVSGYLMREVQGRPFSDIIDQDLQ